MGWNPNAKHVVCVHCNRTVRKTDLSTHTKACTKAKRKAKKKGR